MDRDAHEPEVSTRIGRRRLIRDAAGSAAAAVLLGRGAAAAPADPLAGAVVTPNPIKASIAKSGIAVELVDFCQPPRTSSSKPYALLNLLYHAGLSTYWLYANDTRGRIWRIHRRTGNAYLFFDYKAARGSALQTGQQKGLRGFAFHPDFQRYGRPGYRRFYTVATESTGSAQAGVPVFDGPFVTQFHNVLTEWRVSSLSPPTADPSSRREILRISNYFKDHCTDLPMFNPNAVPGDADYGMLYLATGDGGRYNANPDPYNQAQDKRSLRGKMLRINPLAGNGKRYQVPADNPFVGNSAYRPEVWALGLRHPQYFSWDIGGAKTFVLVDIGQDQIEEVNLAIPGANYGWPLREGTFVTDRTDQTTLYALPPDDAARGFTYPVAQYDHSEGKAICGGFVYRGTAIPALVGHYIFGDLINGRIFHLPVDSLQQGSQATIYELTLKRNGVTRTMLDIVDGAGGRVDLRFGQDQVGGIYVMSKQDGWIRRMAPA